MVLKINKLYLYKYRLVMKYLLIILCSFISPNVFAQQKKISKASTIAAAPKLVVGIVIDQMRWDYLYRFGARYGSGGFKRLMKQGFNFENAYIPYVPSYTAVGHSTIFNGSVPAISGIVGNNWWEKTIKKNMYCTSDSTVTAVGGTELAGKMSPRNMHVTSICDELKLSNNFKSKVIGIALKDRGSILPAGHSANAAYWFDEAVGKWVTSSFYMNSLPQWVMNFNAMDEPSKMMLQDWNTLYTIQTYEQSTEDDQPFEGKISGIAKSGFPYQTSTLTKGKYSSFKFLPAAVTYTFDFGKQAIKSENLGKGSVTDFLTLSVSSTDYVGHTFGPNSIEMEDMMLRLDKDVSDFLSFLDIELGVGNYTVMLTADHGAAHVPAYLKSKKIPAGVFLEAPLEKEINEAVKTKFDIDRVIENAQNYQLYLNDKAIAAKNVSKSEVINLIVDVLKNKDFISDAFATLDIQTHPITAVVKEKLINSYNYQRSGDIQFLLKPAFFEGYGSNPSGTTHGLWNPYDTHIPLLFFGWGVKKGNSHTQVSMSDIAPTLAAMLHIQEPNGSVGRVLTEMIDK